MDSPDLSQLMDLLKSYGHAFGMVVQHMDWNTEKTQRWFDTTSPLLGNYSPNELFVRDRGHKVQAFIDDMLG